ncbi:MAG: HEAT repeat domain-containing protein [Deltaproteobacteria bacterium]|jgi:HEAT repeat protein
MASGKKSKDHVDKILALLDDSASDRRTAAAIVLGVLAIDETRVLDGLRRATRNKEDAKLRAAAAEAIGEIAPRSIVDDLRPLLEDPNKNVREKAKQVLASGRGVTEDDVATMLARDEKQKIGAIAVLGAMGTRAAQEKIIGELPTGTGAILDAARRALTPILEALDASDAQSAVDRLGRVAETELADNEDLAITLAELIGVVKHEASAAPLVRIAAAPLSDDARIRALELLRGIVQGRKTSERAYETLLGVIESDDTPTAILGPAADTLVHMGLPIALEPRVRKLTSSERTPVRRFAIRALGGVDMAPAAKVLGEVVANGDPTDRELALEAALTTPNGRTALTKTLAAMTDGDKARQVANGLKTRATELMPPTLAFLEEAVIDADENVSPVIIDLLKQVGGESAGRVNETLFDRASKLKKRGQYGDATELFKRIVRSKDDAEARFQLGVCELKSSRRVISRGKKSDPCLTTFARLLEVRDFPLLERLQQEPILGEEELYYLGFSLAEGDSAGQGLGGDILMAIAEGEKDTKLRRMAKNKLVTMGWLE